MNQTILLEKVFLNKFIFFFSTKFGGGIRCPIFLTSKLSLSNLKVVFPPPYERELLYLKKTNVDHIRKAINGFQWEKSLQHMNVNDMVHLFNRTIKNILHNFITHEIITCDDKDPF